MNINDILNALNSSFAHADVRAAGQSAGNMTNSEAILRAKLSELAPQAIMATARMAKQSLVAHSVDVGHLYDIRHGIETGKARRVIDVVEQLLRHEEKPVSDAMLEQIMLPRAVIAWTDSASALLELMNAKPGITVGSDDQRFT